MAAIAGNHGVRAVGADIVECADLAVGAAHDESAATEELEADVVASLGQLALVAHHLPGRHEDVFALEFVKLRAVIDPGGERQLDRRIDGRRRRRRLGACGRGRFDARRDPGKHAAEIRATLPSRSLAVEAVALEQDSLPLLVNEAHEPLRDRLRVRPGRGVAARRDELLAEVYDHPAPRRIALPADALVVAAGLALGEKRIPDRDLVRIGQCAAEARIHDAEERTQVVVARVFEDARHRAGKLFRHLAQRREQERFLAAEVEVDRGRRVPGDARDLRGGQLRQAVLRNRGNRRLDQVEFGAAGADVGAGFEIRGHVSLLAGCHTFYPAARRRLNDYSVY